MSEAGVWVTSKVVDRSRLGREDLARGDCVLLCLEVACGIGYVEGVVPDKARLRILVGVKVEVRVLGQYKRCSPSAVARGRGARAVTYGFASSGQ